MGWNSRRYARALGAGVGLALLAAACGDDDGEGGASGETSEAPVPTETSSPDEPEFDPDGELVVMLDKQPVTLDPAKTINNQSWPYIFEIYDRLIGRDADNGLVPMLATDWSFSDDGLTFDMELRDDVRFNDGTPLTSADVKASLDRAKTVAGTAWGTILAPVVAVETPGTHEVRIVLDRPLGSLPAVLTSPAGAVINAKVIAEGRDLGIDPGRAAGSGPRVVTDLVVNSRADFERADDDYWDPEANRLAKVTILFAADAEARLNAFRSGQADVIKVNFGIAEQAKALADSDDSALYKEKEGAGQFVVYFNSKKPGLAEVAVRRALNLAIDREAIESFFDGDCTATTQLYGEGQPGYDPDLDDQFEYDPEEAKRLLGSTGVGNLTLDLVFPAVSPYDVVATLVQEQLKAVGVEVSVAGIDGASSTTQFIGGQGDMLVGNMVAQIDPSQIVNNHFLGVQKLSVDVAPEVEALQAEGLTRRGTSSDWEEKYQEIAAVAGEKALYIPICNIKAQYLVNLRVGGFEEIAGQKDSAGLEARDLWVLP
ncbi:MAG: ABC transporter substrate-binding protein [Acidimicrobiia bacterium]